MEIKQLKGGKVITAKARIPEVKRPNWRVGSPGTLFSDTETGQLLLEVAKKGHAIPVVTHAQVIFRELEGIVYLVVAPVRVPATPKDLAGSKGSAKKAQAAEKPDDVYEVKRAPQLPVIYHLHELIASLGQPLRDDFWYVMDVQVVNDEDLGLAVAGDWTHARLEPRERPKRKGAGKAQAG